MCVLLSPKYSYDKCCYVPVFWFITPWTSLSRLPPPANVTVNAPRTMFKHESPNKRIPARCEGAIFVVFCSETNLTTFEFDPGRPYLMALEHYVQNRRANALSSSMKCNSIYRYLAVKLKIYNLFRVWKPNCFYEQTMLHEGAMRKHQ